MSAVPLDVYTQCVYTGQHTEQGSEVDKLMIDNFLTTLAGIAMNIATRNLQGENEGGI